MSECRELEPLLAAYVDGEADAAGRTRVEAHVEACGCCRNRLSAQQTMCESLRARRQGLRGCAPGDLKARCASMAPRPAAAPRATVHALAPARWMSGARRWMPMTAAAAVLLVVAAVFGLGLDNKVQALALQATIDHAACSRFNLGSTPEDPADVAERWQARFGWPIRVPGSTGKGDDLELRNVRRCAVLDGRVAHILYVWKGEPLSLYVLPRAVLDEAPAFVHRLGHDAVMWSKNDRTYMLVSNHRRDEALQRVVAYVRANTY